MAERIPFLSSHGFPQALAQSLSPQTCSPLLTRQPSRTSRIVPLTVSPNPLNPTSTLYHSHLFL